MNSTCKFLTVCLRLLVVVGFLQFLIVEANDQYHHENGERRIRAGGLHIDKETARNMKQDFVEAVNIGRRKHRVLSKLELNYFSKRRVPNGPDPIHNRRAGNSHRPPGHA